MKRLLHQKSCIIENQDPDPTKMSASCPDPDCQHCCNFYSVAPQENLAQIY
jgi:hypothetical protein